MTVTGVCIYVTGGWAELGGLLICSVWVNGFMVATLSFHLRMSPIFKSSCSATAASNPARRGLWLRLLVCELNPPLPGLSPCREPLWCSASEWEEPERRSKPPEGPDAGAVVIEEQKLRLSHKAPQFCSHCSRTLLIIASFTSSPQPSKMFTSSTYGLPKWNDSGQLW